ncbi:MAG: GAP family protein [Mycobacterium sp.]|nr:GAP family protein [Mycobacterium sp.]
MSSHLAAVATLALAIFFSPETLVLGLIVVGNQQHPRLAAFTYALGGITGIAFATGIGLMIAHISGSDAAALRHDSWAGFAVRVAIAGVLLIIGLTRAANAIRHEPIPDITKTQQKPGRLRTELNRRFPGMMKQFQPGAELSVRQRLVRALLAGFAMCGLHPKVFPIAIAAGHQISQITDPDQRTLAVVLFAVIAVVPAVLPALIEIARPGSSVRVKDGYERVMNVHGRWITAALLLSAAAIVGHSAWERYPG